METFKRDEEVINSATHALGIFFGIISLPFLIAETITHRHTPGIASVCIYSFSFLLVFTCSAIFHITRKPELRRLFKICDHISIYFLIAGTYTPFLVMYMNNAFGHTLLCVLWGLTLAGIFFKIRFTGRFEIVSTIIYILMGWIMIAGGDKFFDALPHPVVMYICVGGAVYTIGAFFYIFDRYKYTHAVWHLFVIAGAICHFTAVWLAV
ncbi:MAG TPA: hemolysin III family protein [Chitinophagaceae bacterium]|nr:hemolysin III family protein [Chitinophagaceae bacterium]